MKDVVIFFDLFDTLTTANRGYLEPYFDSEIDKLGDLGILKDSEMAIEEIIKKYPILLQKYTKEEMIGYYEENMEKSITSIDIDVYNMLDNLKTKGYKLCIISDACFTDIANWRRSPLSLLFDKTIFSCEVGCVKPNSKIYEIAKEIMGNPKKCIFVGDGGHDELYGASMCEMKTIKANWFVNRSDGKVLDYSDYQVDNVKKLNEIIKEI